MSESRTQNFANHGHFPKWFMAQLVLSIITLGVMVYGTFIAASDHAIFFLGVGSLILAVNTITIFLHLRFTALLLQDRLIRLEMQTRLYRVLPSDMHARIPSLNLGQLVSIRFESDANLPGLVEKVLKDNITQRSDIKKLVKDWQADWMRV